MIRAKKYTNCKTGIINVAGHIIALLNEKGPMTYNNLLGLVQNCLGENSKCEFQNALNFLFLLGKINYYCETDVLELIK